MIFRTRFFDGGKESAFVEGSSFRTSFIDNKKDGELAKKKKKMKEKRLSPSTVRKHIVVMLSGPFSMDPYDIVKRICTVLN